MPIIPRTNHGGPPATAGAKTTAVEPIRREKIPPQVMKHLGELYPTPEELDGYLATATEHMVLAIAEALGRMELGIAAAAVAICSDDCSCKVQCPLYLAKKAPRGRTCPIEIELFKKSLAEYKQSVLRRLKEYETVDQIEGDKVVMDIIYQLVETDLYDWRINGMIASVGMVEEVPTLATKDEVYYRMEESVAYRAKEKIQRSRAAGFRQLLATPEMVARTKTNNNNARGTLDRMNEASSKVRGILSNSAVEVTAKILEEERKPGK